MEIAKSDWAKINENAPALTHLPLPASNNNHARQICLCNLWHNLPTRFQVHRSASEGSASRVETDTQTYTWTGPRILPLPLMREVMTGNLTKLGLQVEVDWMYVRAVQGYCNAGYSRFHVRLTIPSPDQKDAFGNHAILIYS